MTTRSELYVVASGEPSRPEDVEAVGAYKVTVSADLPDAAKASAAIDAFHASVAIRLPEEFSIEVVDSDGNQLCEDPAADSYQHGGAATFHGKVDAADVPQPNHSAP